MQYKQIEKALYGLLHDACLAYGLTPSSAEIADRARVHAQAYLLELRDEKTAESLELAFLMHRREERFFPKPVDILARLPMARRYLNRRRLRQMLAPADRDSTITPGYGRMMSALVRRDFVELARLAKQYPQAARLLAGEGFPERLPPEGAKALVDLINRVLETKEKEEA